MMVIRGKEITLEERREINKLLREGFSLSEISRKLSRGKNTVIAEVRRNGGAESYNPVQAEARAILMKNKRAARCRELNQTRPLSPYEQLAQRIQNLEMQVEILVDAIKELSHEG